MVEREREPYILTISDPNCAVGLQSTWGLGNQLFLFPGKKGNLIADDRAPAQTPYQEIQEVKWDTDMHNDIPRKLVNESHNIFMLLQTQAAEASGSALHPHLVKASKQYRAVLKACSMGMVHLTESTTDDALRGHFEDQVQISEMTEMIWSLCEIFFIDVPAGGLVITQLIEWLRWHFTDGEKMAVEILREEKPEDNLSYWDTIYRLVLQGQLEAVRHLLSTHSGRGRSEFQSIEELLRKMPVYSKLFRGHSISEFDMKWRHWWDECKMRLEQGEFATNKNLEIIARILCGEEEVFTDLRDLCETWYHMLVSKMLYQNPTVKAADLHYYVQGCLDEYRVSSRLGELDGILLSTIEFDIHQVIKDSSAVLSNWWFVAHLTDLLQHCGQLETHRLEFGSNLREYLLLEYASSLMSHKSLWQVGIDYLDHCTEFGRKYIEHYIEHIPLETEKKALKVLGVCDRRNMAEQAKSICKVMGRRCMQHGRLGSALSWFLRSKDVAFATLIAEKFLFEYSENGSFSNLDLIDNLGSTMLLSKRLTFLGKYREFHKLYGDKDHHAAGSLLLSLLTARLAPRDFWITLLTDCIPLLEADKMIFSSMQTYELMHCLEELTKETLLLSASQNKAKTPDSQDRTKAFTELEKEKIDLLRLALTRNLSRAIVTEGTIKTL
ncbi:hypothetical protein ScPMuIL_005125 [Solemya velum]